MENILQIFEFFAKYFKFCIDRVPTSTAVDTQWSRSATQWQYANNYLYLE